MKLLYGTANQAKLNHMRKMLDGIDLEIIGLNEVDLKLDTIDESGNNPLENARIKALAYYKAVKMAIFSCDSGLYIDDVEDKDQPGVHVRRVNGKSLNDEEMIEYYTGLAFKHGGELKARYRNAICLVLDENRIFQYDGADIASEDFIITSKPHPNRDIGFPLDSISIEIETGQYYMDKESYNDYEDDMAEGFRRFFIKALGL